ncbi:MAG: phytanoyl-CoA dioxygenase family protein [Planctomycetes bacterium]|nr:phytanoyl-CoA dioxygenase family protein [Planctomycetota bacterium]
MLTPEQIAFFHEQGYIHVPGLIPRENCAAVVDAIFEFLNLSPDRPDEWYNSALKPGYGGMVEMYHHPSMWVNRQLPEVYEVFRAIMGTDKLVVTLDRVSMKPPVSSKSNPDWTEKSFVHLDADPTDPRWATEYGVQGVVYLTDTDESMGGFHCVPGFHRKHTEWLRTPKDRRSEKPPDFSGIVPTPIPGKAGDMVIWDFMLPHGNGVNHSNRPRFAQYITMLPAVLSPETIEDRIQRWRGSIPNKVAVKDAPPPTQDPAPLTPLGRKLLGLDPW